MKLRSPAEALNLFGQNDENLRILRGRLNATVIARGDELRLSGDEADVREAENTFRMLLTAVRAGEPVSRTELEFGDWFAENVARQEGDAHPDLRDATGPNGTAGLIDGLVNEEGLAPGGRAESRSVAVEDRDRERPHAVPVGATSPAPHGAGAPGGGRANQEGFRAGERRGGAAAYVGHGIGPGVGQDDAGPGQAPKDTRVPARAKPKTAGQARYLDAIARDPIVFGSGPAGTGKTYLAVAMAVEALSNRRVKRIILTRPAVEAGEKLGFLPGDLQAKIDPYLRPLYDALYDMLPADRVDKLLELGTIEVAPLAFMRGRTLNDAFIILDEAQNTTAEQMKMFLTRMGFNSRVVVTGDITQTDLPGSVKSGLLTAQRILAGIEGIGFIQFTKADVVRHPLVAQIILAYEQHG